MVSETRWPIGQRRVSMRMDLLQIGKLFQSFWAVVCNNHLPRQSWEWIDEGQTDEVLDIVRSEKRRRQSRLGDLVFEETDIVFTLPKESTEFALPKSHDELAEQQSRGKESTRLELRSWAVESDDPSQLLETIAKRWHERFRRAASVSAQAKSLPSMWVASYPEMVLRVPHLLLQSSSTKQDR